MRDLNITVEDVLDWLALGASSDEILADYPQLSLDDINACIAYGRLGKATEAHRFKRS